MAKFIEWTPDQEREWANWVAARPDAVRSICERYPADRLYRLKSTGQRVTIYSYSENETLTVNVSGDYNLVTFGRRVFGISPNDLEECDLPSPDEPVGSFI